MVKSTPRRSKNTKKKVGAYSLRRSKSVSNLRIRKNTNNTYYDSNDIIISEIGDLNELSEFEDITSEKKEQFLNDFFNNANLFCGNTNLPISQYSLSRFYHDPDNDYKIYLAFKKENKPMRLIDRLLGICVVRYYEKYNLECLNKYDNDGQLKGYDVREYNYIKNEVRLANINMICALTPDFIPYVPMLDVSKYENVYINPLRNPINYFKKLVNKYKTYKKNRLKRRKYHKSKQTMQYRDRMYKMPNIGGILLDGVIEKIKENGYSIIRLFAVHYSPENTRVNFYKKHNFKHVYRYPGDNFDKLSETTNTYEMIIDLDGTCKDSIEFTI